MITHIAIYGIGGSLLGGLIAWAIQSVRNKRHIDELTAAASKRIDKIAGERDAFAKKYSKVHFIIEQLEAKRDGHDAELSAALEKSKLYAKNVRILKKEREHTKSKLGKLQSALVALKRQTSNLQTEFDKTREFYKRELLKSLTRRKELEEDVVKARAEQESFAQAVESSVLEHGSEEDMVIAAQLRLGQLEVLERNVNKLEAENAQLRDDARRVKQEYSSRERDLKELEQLRVNNRQLVQAVEALEDSRKEYEADAQRFRQQADQSEKLSDTLQLRLEDLEKNFADIEKQQDEAIEDVRNAAVVPILRNQG